VAQCQRLGDEAWATDWCRRLVRSRLRGQWRLLQIALAARADLRKPLTDASASLHKVLQALPDAADRAALRGLEGAGAAAFFRGYATLFAPALGFVARRRRPPPDPVNASLSLGYTLLHGRAVQACWAAGLDPLVGFLHLPVHGRASLACDLMEPWRAHVEQWVWGLWRERVLRPEHFGRDGAQACLLGKAGRANFYAAAHAPLAHCQRGLLRQARWLARDLAASAGQLGWADETQDPWDADDAAATQPAAAGALAPTAAEGSAP
jgi:CRISPR-associated protein Cas1